MRDYAPPLGTVLADRHRIAQVLSNLLGNALKFTPPGGTVSITAAVESCCASIYVKDSGPGIPTEALRLHEAQLLVSVYACACRRLAPSRGPGRGASAP